ncbi:hypothetical protein OROGR_020864 [Orobanche gracilis]
MSFNSFTGDLPISLRSLTNLTGGCALSSCDFRNIEDNHFSGVIRETIQNISNLWFGGNNFVRETNYPQADSIPEEQNIPASANFSVFENKPPLVERTHKRGLRILDYCGFWTSSENHFFTGGRRDADPLKYVVQYLHWRSTYLIQIIDKSYMLISGCALSSSDFRNIEDNHFSGIIPKTTQNIPNFWFGGNNFVRETNYPQTDSIP